MTDDATDTTTEQAPPERPTGAVSVMFPGNSEQLAAMLAPLSGMKELEARLYEKRSQWLANLGHYCAALHPEERPEFGAFLSPTDPPLVTVVLWCMPPVIVMETPFQVSNQPPPDPTVSRLVGPDGRPLN